MEPSRSLAARAWTDVPAGLLLAVPVGSCEQHGPHLPLATDTIVAEALAGALADAREDVVVGPPVAVGASGEHAGFPGTLSIGAEVLTAVLVELIRSAIPPFAGVVLVNGHGGNAGAVRSAVATSRDEGRAVVAWSPRLPVGDAHAGRTETSLMLALAPELVATERAERGATAPLRTLLPALRQGGVRAVSPNGVLGDPSGASAAEGARLLAELAADLVAAVHDAVPPAR